MDMRRCACALGVVLSSACSADETSPPSQRGTTIEQPGPSAPAADSGKPAAPPDRTDAGAFTGIAKPDESQPLQARIQVNGSNITCGMGCAVLIAQAQGGKQPYSYRWSDPTLVGPGPHRICPEKPGEISLTVTDDSQSDTPEFAMPAQTAQAIATVECSAAGLDSGTLADFTGCGSMIANASDAGAITCETGDGGYYSGTGMLPMPILAGHTYNLSYDQLIPIVIGEPVVVDVYGSNKPCELEEKLTTWTLDGTWHHPGCFTPTKNFDYVLIRVYVGFTLFYLDFLQTATFCAGCEEG